MVALTSALAGFGRRLGFFRVVVFDTRRK